MWMIVQLTVHIASTVLVLHVSLQIKRCHHAISDSYKTPTAYV